MIYAVFSDDGRTAWFYPPGCAWTNIPPGAIVISEADWQEFLSHPGVRRWSGTAIVPCDPAV